MHQTLLWSLTVRNKLLVFGIFFFYSSLLFVGSQIFLFLSDTSHFVMTASKQLLRSLH